MRLAETRNAFARQLTFPADRETVLAAVGDTTLEAPYGDPETIRTVLERTDESSFESADELFDTVLANVGEQYIGRKHYDDRGAQGGIETEEVHF
ncbi:hypothetical protein C2R22_08910 [Salinigranum rubrum]|uniref:DUF2795 domain-containing protein n=1 Tax=Salinigranum rubrum TaxID=755307 RepID=A0A2I8VIN7_9EURY|nr:DUF5789 family protein [Salinigranum rubrum]AUV81754.1 hypothetical protein C2R22_08910 [Salinigranum rubrum]